MILHLVLRIERDDVTTVVMVGQTFPSDDAALAWANEHHPGWVDIWTMSSREQAEQMFAGLS